MNKSVLKKIFLCCMIIISTLTLVSFSKEINDKNYIYIVLRYDDYSTISSTAIELRIIDVLRKNGGCITFGVIPFVSTGDWHNPHDTKNLPLTLLKAKILENAINDGVLEVAQHGFSHKTNSDEHSSEFSGLDYETQKNMIAEGKCFLERVTGTPVKTFIPPWNTYDVNTLRALESLAFSTVSASMRGEAHPESKLSYLPTTVVFSQIREAVDIARRTFGSQSVIVALFHAYDLIEVDRVRGNITIEQMFEIINWISSQQDLKLITISQAAQTIDDLSVKRYISNRRHFLLNKLLPPILRGKGSTLIYRETHLFPDKFLVGKVFCFYLLIVLLGFSSSFLVAKRVTNRSGMFIKILRIGSILILVLMFIFLMRRPLLFNSGLNVVVIAGIVSAIIGLFFGLRLRDHKRI